MRKGITVEVSAADRARLEAVVADRNSPQKPVGRPRLALPTAGGLGTTAIVRRAGVSKPCVRRWQARFMAEGLDGLLRDKTRPPGTPPLPRATVERVVELTRQVPPGETTHWTKRAMAKAIGISLSARRARHLEGARAGAAPGADLQAVQGPRVHQHVARHRRALYAPPAHAVVLSVDEKSQIQALDRTQPGLPTKEGRCATMTHDDERNG